MTPVESFCAEVRIHADYKATPAALWTKPECIRHAVRNAADKSSRIAPLDNMAVAVRYYLEAPSKEQVRRRLNRLYKAIAASLTAAGVPTDYLPAEEHKVQSGAVSVAIMSDTAYIFQMRRPLATVPLRWPELFAYAMPMFMQGISV